MKNKISKKTFYWIFTILNILLFLAFNLGMYLYFGSDVLLQKGIARTAWLLGSIIIICISFVRDIIIKKIYK